MKYTGSSLERNQQHKRRLYTVNSPSFCVFSFSLLFLLFHRQFLSPDRISQLQKTMACHLAEKWVNSNGVETNFPPGVDTFGKWQGLIMGIAYCLLVNMPIKHLGEVVSWKYPQNLSTNIESLIQPRWTKKRPPNNCFHPVVSFKNSRSNSLTTQKIHKKSKQQTQPNTTNKHLVSEWRNGNPPSSFLGLWATALALALAFGAAPLEAACCSSVTANQRWS